MEENGEFRLFRPQLVQIFFVVSSGGDFFLGFALVSPVPISGGGGSKKTGAHRERTQSRGRAGGRTELINNWGVGMGKKRKGKEMVSTYTQEQQRGFLLPS